MSKSAAVPSLPKSKKLLPTSSKNSQNIYQWTNKLSSLSIPKRIHCLRSPPERFFQGISGFPNIKRKKFGDSFTLGQQQRPSIAQGRKKD
jgi:hypothetical protein